MTTKSLTKQKKKQLLKPDSSPANQVFIDARSFRPGIFYDHGVFNQTLKN